MGLMEDTAALAAENLRELKAAYERGEVLIIETRRPEFKASARMLTKLFPKIITFHEFIRIEREAALKAFYAAALDEEPKNREEEKIIEWINDALTRADRKDKD